uniref:Uncharacterized protein n=1 Tax=Anopheles melas TaxID=34690 RepID=A0A182U5T4_9DIPT
MPPTIVKQVQRGVEGKFQRVVQGESKLTPSGNLVSSRGQQLPNADERYRTLENAGGNNKDDDSTDHHWQNHYRQQQQEEDGDTLNRRNMSRMHHAGRFGVR